MTTILSRFVKLNFWMIFLFSVPMFLVSCGGEEATGEDEVSLDDDYYEFQDFNLAPFEIDATIKLPDETANIGASTKPEVIHTEGDIYWELNVGPNFQMVIEDFANIKNIVKDEKKALAENDFFKIKYLVEEDDMIVYERILIPTGDSKASPTVGVEHRSFHVCGQKEINGVTYKFASREEGFEKMIIEIMAKSIRSLEPNK
jgi:hypothetical protein